MPSASRMYKRRKLSKKGVRKIVKAVVNRNLEHKWFLNYKSTTAAASTWTFTSVFDYPTVKFQQGTNVNQRIGDRIKVTKIEFLVFIDPVVGAGGAPMATGTRCKCIVYHNKQANGALPTGAMMYDTDQLNALRLVAKQPAVSVLKEYTHHMSVLSQNAGVSFSAGPPTSFKWVIYPKKTIQFTANSGTITDILRDDYGFGFVTDDGACCNVTCTMKFHFTDA